MQTIKLRISDSIYDKVVWLLSKFNKNEIEIISENTEYLENQNYLTSELNEILQGKANFVEMEEVNERLESIIAKNENNI